MRLPAPIADIARDRATQAIVVELRLPFDPGAPDAWAETRQAADPSKAWEADDDATGSRAVEQRFRQQLASVVERPADGRRLPRDHAITPSGVHNRILTQVLREFVTGTPSTRLDAPVTYRDGSQASNPFPLRCLPLGPELPQHEADLTLHLALLSIRHTEMDPSRGRRLATQRGGVTAATGSAYRRLRLRHKHDAARRAHGRRTASAHLAHLPDGSGHSCRRLFPGSRRAYAQASVLTVGRPDVLRVGSKFGWCERGSSV